MLLAKKKKENLKFCRIATAIGRGWWLIDPSVLVLAPVSISWKEADTISVKENRRRDGGVRGGRGGVVERSYNNITGDSNSPYIFFLSFFFTYWKVQGSLTLHNFLLIFFFFFCNKSTPSPSLYNSTFNEYKCEYMLMYTCVCNRLDFQP